MFIRIKRIAGKEYAYFVQNDWTYEGSRQTVSEYLGSAFRPAKRQLPLVLPSNFREALLAVVEWELKQHGFVQEDANLVSDGIVCDLRSRCVFNVKRKAVVLLLNHGYLCGKTLVPLLDFIPEQSEENTGHSLARALITAGVAVSHEDFIRLVELAHV